MAKIIAYRKYIDRINTRELNLPETSGQRIGIELSTVDGITYVSLPDDATLPVDQPVEISSSIAPVTLTDALRAAISDASPHVRLIRAAVAEKIAERYRLTDEIKLLRTAPSAEFDTYVSYAEDCRAWGREQKAALGL